MDINFYRWRETDRAVRERLVRRSETDIADFESGARRIVEDVRLKGDEALRHFTKLYDKADVDSVVVDSDEFAMAHAELSADLKAAIARCMENVRRFHTAQMTRIERRWMIEIEPGVFAGEQVSPIDSVGLYIPRGKGAFPSAVYMLAVPAHVAGVERIAVVSPPRPDGRADPATLYTAELCGVKEVYKVGGAQAIAALAYGTPSIPPVAKILGPGSTYVTAAKRVLSSIVDSATHSGPSDCVVLCDGSADPENTLYDILNEAEHGPDSAGILVTHDEALALYARDNLPRVINALPEPHRSICERVMTHYGAIILTESLAESIAFTNTYAPEHVVLKIRDPDSVIESLYHVAEILIGENTPSVLANYGIGVNHVLPTGGHARTVSATGVWDFLKRTSLARVTPDGFKALAPSVTTLADYEDFPAHVNAITKRR